MLLQQGWLRLPQGGGVAQVPDWQVPVVQVPLQHGRPITPQVGAGGVAVHMPESQSKPVLQFVPQHGSPEFPQW